MLKKTLRILPILMLVMLLCPVYAINAQPGAAETKKAVENTPQGLEIDAYSAILMESQRGQILYAKNAGKKLHISAACKIMTSLVAVEKQKLDDKATISKESVDAEGSALSLEIGEKYTVEDLLYGIMLTSANDAARALAEFAGGDIQKFVGMMNDTSSKLNLKDTHFANPTGLYDETQYTTAHDIALLIKYAITNPSFNKVFTAQLKPWTSQDGKTTILKSQNKLFWSYDGIEGGKTGYNEKDKQTVIVTARRGNQQFICVILDSPEKTVFENAVKLLDYGFNNFRTSMLVQKDAPQTSIQVGDREINLISINDIYYTHPSGESYIKDIQFNIMNDLKPPVLKSKIAGTARFILNDDTVIDVNLYPEVEIQVPEDFYTSAKKKVLENKDILLLVAFLLLIEVILIIYHIVRLIRKLVRKLFPSKGKKLSDP